MIMARKAKRQSRRHLQLLCSIIVFSLGTILQVNAFLLWSKSRATTIARRARRITSHPYAALRSSSSLADDKGDDDAAKEAPSTSLLQQRLDALSNHFSTLTISQIQKELVERGLHYSHKQQQQQQQQQSHTIDENSSIEMERVPGCVATVRVKTVLLSLSSSSHDNNNSTIISTPGVCCRVEGTADAHLSRGLLAVVASSLLRMDDDDDGVVPVNDVLATPASTLSQRLGLAQTLSPGRSDGLASLWRTIQNQIIIRIQQLEPQQQHQIYNDQRKIVHEMKTPTNITNENNRNKPTVALLLSGGVDSSVALRLLQQTNKYDITAFYLKIWLEDELAHLGECPWQDDYRYCQAVCEQANVPLETVSLQHEYRQKVISYTVREAKLGRTPNPDILCNSRIKFGCFYDYAVDMRHFDYIATGHYAQLVRANDNDRDSSTVRLLRAPDPVKDQSYFLCALTQHQLQRVLFPIGHLQKSAVRQLAQDFALPNRHRPDSQGLCFLGKLKFDQFLAAHLTDQPGTILDAASNEVLGTHRGVWYHTVGQRKGLGKVLDPLATSRGPWYVVAKDPVHNTVYCSNRYDQDMFAAARSEFAVENIHWIAGHAPFLPGIEHEDDNDQSRSSSNPTTEVTRSLNLTMKIRHGPNLVTGTLTFTSNGTTTTNADTTGDVRLDHKDSGLAPGQYVVFYNNDTECLGGGVISERHWTRFLSENQQRQSNTNAVMAST